MISRSKVKILVNRKSFSKKMIFSVTAKHAEKGENDFLNHFHPKQTHP